MATILNGINGEIEVPIWIAKGLDAKGIDYVEKFGEEIFKGGLTTTQIRNFFGEMLKLKAKSTFKEIEQNFILLKPKLAYAAKRANKPGLMDLKKILDIAINTVINGKDDLEKQVRFDNFANFFEAILAYHRAAGGK